MAKNFIWTTLKMIFRFQIFYHNTPYIKGEIIYDV